MNSDKRRYELTDREARLIEEMTGTILRPLDENPLLDMVRDGFHTAIETQASDMDKRTYEKLLNNELSLAQKFLNKVNDEESLRLAFDEIYSEIEDMVSSYVERKEVE